MQVLNQNSSANSQVGLNLPKPTPPQTLTPQTNTPVKANLPNVDKTGALGQKPQVQPTAPTLSTIPVANQAQIKPSLVNQEASANINQQALPNQVSPEVKNSETEVKDKDTKESSTTKDVKVEKIGKKNNKNNKKPGQKKIPTLLGLLVLIISLVAGIFFFGDGVGLFMPRATPETTPKNIVVSNVTDKSFTISFYTDEATIGFIKYGTSVNDVKQQASDDRDQISGMVKPYNLHHVTVRGLEPNTNYYYLLGTGSNATFDNAGSPYEVKTAAAQNNASPNNQTVYGTVTKPGGQPGDGAIIFVTLEGAGPLSTLVKPSGSWAVSLSNAFNSSLNSYPDVNENSVLSIRVQAVEPNLITKRVVNVGNAQPVPEIIMGQEASVEDENLSTTRQELLADDTEEMPSELGPDLSAPVSTESADSLLSEDVTIAEVERVLDLDELNESSSAADTVINTAQPIIKVTLPPNTVVKITVNSETTIETIAETDDAGVLTIDLASLEGSLEPGEHTVNYSYIDPSTGEEVTKTYNFTVSAESADYGRGADPIRTIASAEETQTLPYGSGDPYLPVTEPTPTPIITPIPTIEEVEESTTSVRTTAVSTESGTYNAGSTTNTFGLLMAGLFFSVTGVWSFLLAQQFNKKEL